MNVDDHLFDEQALRLLRAYFKVSDEGAREIIVKLAESVANGARVSVAPVPFSGSTLPDSH